MAAQKRTSPTSFSNMMTRVVRGFGTLIGTFAGGFSLAGASLTCLRK